MLTTAIHPLAVESNSDFTDPRATLFSKMKGQSVHIPDLKSIFSDWKGVANQHVNPSLEPLRKAVSKRIQSLDFSKEKQRKLEASDFALFTALWWPDTPYEKLEILAYLVIWLFTWDDELDEPTGSFMEDFEGGKTYRNHTLQFVGNCLGVVTAEPQLRPQSHLVQSFDVVGLAVRESYNADQRKRLYDGTAQCMSGNEAEQSYRLQDHIPTVTEYWDYRMGTSLVSISAAVGEYSIGSALPSDVMECDLMLALLDANNVITWIINDVLSLRKEMKIGFTDSLIPLIFMSTENAQRAVAEVVKSLRTAKERFDDAANALLSGRDQQDETYRQLQEFIQVLRSNCVGALIWSLETPRFGMLDARNEDGSFTYTLGS